MAGLTRTTATALVMAFVVPMACSQAGEESTERTAPMYAQCLDSRAKPAPPPVVCRVSDGRIVETSNVVLDTGFAFVKDRRSGLIAAINDANTLVVVSDGSGAELAAETAGLVFAFGPLGELWSLDVDGTLRAAGGDRVMDFAIDGVVDLKSGIDVYGSSVLMTVDRSPNGFQVVVGDATTGEVVEVARDVGYVGEARWSPDGAHIAYVGHDYESIEVVKRDGTPTSQLAPRRAVLSKRMNSPTWVDGSTIAFMNASPAVVIIDAFTSDLIGIVSYDSKAEIFPALLMAP